MSPLFDKKTDPDDDDEAPEGEPDEPVTDIVPADVVEVVPADEGEAPTTKGRRPQVLVPLSTPPQSYIHGILVLWASIEAHFNEWAHGFHEDPEAEDWLIDNQERLYQKIISWTKTGDPWLILREARIWQEEHDDEEYVEWLHMRCEQELYKRHILFDEPETIEWGSNLRELPFLNYFTPDEIDQLLTKNDSSKPNLINLVGYMVAHNKRSGTTTAVIDGSKEAVMGLTGLGKSRTGLMLAGLLDGTDRGFDIIRDVVYKHDENALKRNFFVDEVVHHAHLMDEGELWLDRRRSTSRETRGAGWEFMTKRYKQQYDLIALPSIFILDERFRRGLVQWRFKIVKRGLVKVYMNNNEEDEDSDQWGRFVTEFKIPDVPDRIGKLYEYSKRSIDKWGTLEMALSKDEAFARVVLSANSRMSDIKRRWLDRANGASGPEHPGGVSKET